MQVESNLIHVFILIKSASELYCWYTVCLMRVSTVRICNVEGLNENEQTVESTVEVIKIPFREITGGKGENNTKSR